MSILDLIAQMQKLIGDENGTLQGGYVRIKDDGSQSLSRAKNHSCTNWVSCQGTNVGAICTNVTLCTDPPPGPVIS